MSERGKYIVLEGGDGVGKSTQAILLDNHIRTLGYDTLQVFNDETGKNEPVREPGGTESSNRLRRIIKDKSIERTPWQNVEWFTQARASIMKELIEPALARGAFVITSRNWLSTVAYQGYGQGIPVQEIEDYTRENVGEAYLHPDMVRILSLNPELRQSRMIHRDETNSQLDTFESMPLSFQQGMENGYDRISVDRHIPTIDAHGSRTRVFRRVLKHVEPLLT